jgi:hypothetical protein
MNSSGPVWIGLLLATSFGVLAQDTPSAEKKSDSLGEAKKEPPAPEVKSKWETSAAVGD